MSCIRLIAVDLDGTLLNEKHQPGELSISILKKALERGISVIIVTGRMNLSAQKFAAQIGDIPVISYNGAMLCQNGKVLYHCPVDSNLAEQIIRCTGYNDLLVYLHDRLYVKKVTESVKSYVKRAGVYPNCFIDFCYHRTHPSKLIWASEHDYQYKLQLLKNSFGNQIYVTSSMGNLLEIMNPAVSKWNTLYRYSQSIGVDSSEICSFGDGDNDTGMLLNSGIGVAMGNAGDLVKSSADFVTLSNNEDGIYCFLRDKI